MDGTMYTSKSRQQSHKSDHGRARRYEHTSRVTYVRRQLDRQHALEMRRELQSTYHTGDER